MRYLLLSYLGYSVIIDQLYKINIKTVHCDRDYEASYSKALQAKRSVSKCPIS